MTRSATVRVMSPEEITALSGGETPFLQWPQPSLLFAQRQMRLLQLAGNGHAMADFLRFMAAIAQAQQDLLTQWLARSSAAALPDAKALDQAARMGVAPLPATDWPRDAAWRAGLKSMLPALRAVAPEAARAAIDRIAGASDDWLEAQADALLGGTMAGLELATAPLIAAALQAWWTHLLLALHAADPNAVGRIDDASVCPACASKPTASHVQPQGQRYLHCSLCSLQWHLVRTKCSHCGSDKHVAYQSLTPSDADAADRAADAVVQAETCDDCHHYLKLVHADRDPQVDPVADDLASLTLDLLVADAGLQRHGVNLMLLFGAPAEPDPPDPGAT